MAKKIKNFSQGNIAVPTGIYTAELARAFKKDVSNVACQNCSEEGHDTDAEYCKYCGVEL